MRDLNPNSSQNRRILILLNYKTLGKSPKNPFIIIIIFTQMKKKKLKKIYLLIFSNIFFHELSIIFLFIKIFFNSLYFLLLEVTTKFVIKFCPKNNHNYSVFVCSFSCLYFVT